MKSIVISPKNLTDMRFVCALLKKLSISTKVLSDEEKEGLGLSILMREVDRTKKVRRETIMRKFHVRRTKL
ncbi:MAG: hypothetical protein QME52_04445 [Bacteroidota bacterium]|nr:hypothetical protein [Bacteroidota bacterium]